MAIILFFLSIVLGLVMVLTLIIPGKILAFTSSTSRVKALLYFGVPALLAFILSMVLGASRLELALEDPENTIELSLSRKNLKQLPPELSKLVNLQKLDLSRNAFTEVPEELKELSQLTSLDLSDNPIETLPEWLSALSNLKEMNLSNTKIEQIPDALRNIAISYENTPLWDANQPKTTPVSDDIKQIESTKTGDVDHTESVTDYAFRQLIGSDYGFKRKFKKGEVYYDDPVTKEQADQIGNFFVGLDYFNDRNEVTVLLVKTKQVYVLKMVVDASQLTDEVVDSFRQIRTFIKSDFYQEDKFHLHLIDTDQKLIKEIKE